MVSFPDWVWPGNEANQPAGLSKLTAFITRQVSSPPSRVAATSYTIVEMQLPFLAPAVGPSSVSLLCRQRENGKSRDHLSGGLNYVAIALVGNSSYSYDCYI